MSWLEIEQGEAPLIVMFPHSGTDLADVADSFRSSWIARRDTDWWIDRVYDFPGAMGATTVRTAISRSVIDVNRDPSGASLYPGQATTELCPTTTFDGEPLYNGQPPDDAEVDRRKQLWFAPYHEAATAEIERLQTRNDRVVVYDAHSIRSRIPRLFDGELPQFNIGTNDGSTCDRALSAAVASICSVADGGCIVDGRFKGGWTTRRHGRPDNGIHAIQMELSMRGYLEEPDRPDHTNWPPDFDLARAEKLTNILKQVLDSCLAFAELPNS